MNDISEIPTGQSGWFALYTKPRQEFKAASQLGELGIEHYLPLQIKIKQWSDRKKKVSEPLIHGYIFIKANEKERLQALQLYSMVRCVTFNGKPAAIPDWQIENLKIMLASNNEVVLSETIPSGTRVKIISGPFEGVVGIVNETSAGRTLSITIDLLKRSVTATLPMESVVRLADDPSEKT